MRLAGMMRTGDGNGTEDYAAALRALADRAQDGSLPLADRAIAAHQMDEVIKLAEASGVGGLEGLAEQAKRALAAAEASAGRAIDQLGATAHDVVDPAANAVMSTGTKVAITLGAVCIGVPVALGVGYLLLMRSALRAGYNASPTIAKYGAMVVPVRPELAPAVGLFGVMAAHKAGTSPTSADVGAVVAPFRARAAASRAPMSSAASTGNVEAEQLLAGVAGLLGAGGSQSLRALGAIANNHIAALGPEPRRPGPGETGDAWRAYNAWHHAKELMAAPSTKVDPSLTLTSAGMVHR